MREYLSEKNFKKALLFGIVLTAMAVPRIFAGGLDPRIHIVAAFTSMCLLSGAATAWSNAGGMHGLFPEEKRLFTGLAAAGVLVAVSVPLHVMLLDPLIQRALLDSGDGYALAMRFPGSISGKTALVLWGAGFEMMFLYAASMAFFSRLSGSWKTAVGLTVVFRAWVGFWKLSTCGVTYGVPAIVAAEGVTALVACILFALTGLPALVLFLAGLNLHLFLF